MSKTQNTPQIETLVEVQSKATQISISVLDSLASAGFFEDVYTTNEDGSDVEYTENGAYLQEIIFDTVYDTLTFQQ